MKNQYYLQCRGPVGNSVMWWAVDDRGYTCDLRCARVWSQKEKDLKEMRSIEKFYLKDEVDQLVQHHIDIQDLDRKKDGSIYDNNPHTLVQWR